jgi:hypothetical protein
MTQEEVNEGNILIAKFAGLKFGYVETFEDSSTEDDLNYKWNKIRSGFCFLKTLPVDTGLEYEFDRHDRWKYHKYFEEYNKTLNYNLGYHSDWNQLMQIISKIEQIKDDYHGQFGVHIVGNSCTIQSTNFRPDKRTSEPPYYFYSHTSTSKIEATYYVVVEFIKWYNTIKK